MFLCQSSTSLKAEAINKVYVFHRHAALERYKNRNVYPKIVYTKANVHGPRKMNRADYYKSHAARDEKFLFAWYVIMHLLYFFLLLVVYQEDHFLCYITYARILLRFTSKTNLFVI